MSATEPTGVVTWLTGRPASGKTTLALATQVALRDHGVCCCVLDSDALRPVLAPRAAYDDAGRDAFYDALGQLAAALAAQGLVVLVAATAPRRRHRDAARERAPAFLEVHVACPVETCAERDPKGLYAAARAGAVTTLPGLQAPYEEPRAPELALDTSVDRVEEAAARIVALVRATLGGSAA